ncbi:hypothetical protein N7466_010672 [Penicillium verhagenii]|uniref:uncharacterized protein n=1 Tax=Penicillium verhagenii TaxID=1562060 RepID=UPI0025451004|nr:uncharacterized protein N7466_010672 [Penicillium verhagenii]KAJ5918680.1 hypothetical protein N7466_010672 [Penicillium verhagenii]
MISVPGATTIEAVKAYVKTRGIVLSSLRRPRWSKVYYDQPITLVQGELFSHQPKAPEWEQAIFPLKIKMTFQDKEGENMG